MNQNPSKAKELSEYIYVNADGKLSYRMKAYNSPQYIYIPILGLHESITGSGYLIDIQKK